MAIYHEDILDIELESGTVARSFLNHVIGSGDKDANRFGVRTFRGGVPVDLSGCSCQAVFMNAAGVNIALTSYGTVSGNVAYVTLPQACYNVEGQFCLAIKLVGGGVTGTMRIIDGVVDNTGTTGSVAPTSSVPTYQEILETYAAMQAATAAANAAIAEEFDATKEYPAGKYVINDGGLYVLTEAHAANTTWANTSKAAVYFGNELTASNKAIKYADSFTTQDTLNITNDQTLSLYRGMFDNNVYNPETGTVNAYKYRVSSRKAMSFPFDVNITIPSGFRAYFYTYEDEAWVQSGWKTGSYKIEEGVIFYLQIGRTTEDTSETADVDEFLSGFSMETPLENKLSDLKTVSHSANYACDIFENGGYYARDGKLVKGSAAGRVRLMPVMCPDEILVTALKNSGVTFYCYVVNSNGVYDNTLNFSSGEMTGVSRRSYAMSERLENHRRCTLYMIAIANGITADNANEYIRIECVNQTGNALNRAGKNVSIYHFGGAGNDWCFVRTPSNYDPYRNKPFPFVICNHGNGWVMDGTEPKANWTKRTMYIPSTDPDAGSDQYNVTDDESLWYSNPTIEALLTAGYVVCGCENYDDKLYGNNNCRNACVSFFWHMVKNWNVEDRCYMIGASNGAMTSLNAAYILQGHVKAMILQYPLTCLVNQYEHPGSSASGHPAEIRAAYGITNASITEAELTKAVATHDPLTVDVVSGQKVGTFPPTKIYYSESDHVVNYEQNAIPLYNMLYASNKVVEKVKKSGEHGDKSMFVPSEFVAWFNAN